jgi:hypothetical protein
VIRVKMELLPGGSESGAVHLGTIVIANDLFGSLQTEGKRGSYRCIIFKKSQNKVWKKITIKDYPRRAYHPWELVRRILNEAL